MEIIKIANVDNNLVRWQRRRMWIEGRSDNVLFVWLWRNCWRIEGRSLKVFFFACGEGVEGCDWLVSFACFDESSRSEGFIASYFFSMFSSLVRWYLAWDLRFECLDAFNFIYSETDELESIVIPKACFPCALCCFAFWNLPREANDQSKPIMTNRMLRVWHIFLFVFLIFLKIELKLKYINVEQNCKFQMHILTSINLFCA